MSGGVLGSCNIRISYLLCTLGLLLVGCGSSPKTMTTPTASALSYPSTPPEPITWSPSSTLPAPPAQDPSGSNDFPLTVSSPTDDQSLTSPATVVASASPTNPIFFMRVYVDGLAVYFTFDSSINAVIWMSPGSHTLTVMAEDKKGYISAIIIHVNISSQPPTVTSDI